MLMLKRSTLLSALSMLVLSVLLLLAFVPVALMIVFSLRDTFSIQFDFWALPRLPRWSNYGGALMYLTEPVARTMYVAAVSIAGITLFSCVAAYAFARLKFFGKEVLFYLFLFILLVPSVLTLTPNFVLATSLGLRNSLEGLIIFYVAGGQALSIFLLRTFLQSQPEDIFEAARIDGASEFRMVWTIAIPLAQPVLITLCIMNFLTIYNDFVWPLLMLISKDLYTVTIILQSYGGDVSAAMAGYVVASLPILVAFSYGMDYYVEGLTSGAIRA
jgi:ABC-type glycerol-3-phosphate transport system permease component